MTSCEKEAWTYTKWITAINTMLYVGIVIFSLVMWAWKREWPEDLLQAVSLPYMAVMGFYFGKSLLENKWKKGEA
jgi:hypothetical protein